MKNVRIVFNRTNIDSMCATSMLVNFFKLNNYNVETVPYCTTTYCGAHTSNQYQYTFIIGHFLDSQEILSEADQTNDKIFIISPEFLTEQSLALSCDKSIILHYAPNAVNNTLIHTQEDCFSSCVSKLTKNLILNIPTFSTFDKPIFENDLINAIENYIGVKNVQAQDILLVHENYDRIVYSAHTATVVCFDGYDKISNNLKENPLDSNKKDIKTNNERIFKCRLHIRNSMSKQLYGDTKQSFLVQTIQIIEDYLYDVARLATYTYDTVVLYQDIKNNRHWWIYSVDQEKANVLASKIPQIKRIKDGVFIHLISTLPKVQ